MNTYEKDIININSANLAANLKNLDINEEILHRNKIKGDYVIYLLLQILEAIRNDSK